MTAARVHDDFRSRLLDFELETLEGNAHSVFALSPQLSLLYFNPAYVLFAAANGGPAVTTKFPLGSKVLDACGGELRPFYEKRLGEVLATHTAWHHDYECSSADTFREFRQSVYPLANGLGLVLINSLKVEVPRAAGGPAPSEAGYLHDGWLTQCSNCRRTKRNDGSEEWDWVPVWVSHMPNHTRHSICRPCRDYYWR